MASNKRKKKSMKTALYGKIKERKGEWLIGVSTKNLLHLSIVATQHKTRQTRARPVRYVDAQARINNW